MAKEKKTTQKIKKAVKAVKEAVAPEEKAEITKETFIKGIKVLSSEEVIINGNKKIKATIEGHTIVIVNEDEVKSSKK